MKVVRTHGDEIKIAQLLACEELLVDLSNHCVPIFYVLPDPVDNQMSLLVMPYLRPFNVPEFDTAAEVVDFIHQTLEV